MAGIAIEESERGPAAAYATRANRAAVRREGLQALQREYEAFVESAFQTLALISDRRITK